MVTLFRVRIVRVVVGDFGGVCGREERGVRLELLGDEGELGLGLFLQGVADMDDGVVEGFFFVFVARIRVSALHWQHVVVLREWTFALRSLGERSVCARYASW